MSETVLLVGGGGREHAIAEAIADGPAAELVACASNRNPGIEALSAAYREIGSSEVEEIVAFGESVGATLAIIGPESALAAGVADALDAAGIYAFGPPAALARIETDKRFQREFMAAESISGTAAFETFDSARAAAEYIETVDDDVAVKPRGLTGGKGVRVTGDQVTHEEAAEYVRTADHEDWVVEERLVGEEFTLQAFVANGSVRVSPAIQDHKRAFAGDEGPNTGGMGSYSAPAFELPFMNEDAYSRAEAILRSTAAALEGYKGVLYGQFMLTVNGPMVVEFNARFGDPEALNTLALLETDLLAVLQAARDGTALPELAFDAKATVCKYAVPAGYPTAPDAGASIDIDPEQAAAADVGLFYASVDVADGQLVTTTSRSFALVGVAETIQQAEAAVSEAFAETSMDGLRVREDVGSNSLVERRIEHMERLRRR